MKFYFIRHGVTKGNLEKRYIGRTDEPLCPEGISGLKRLKLPACETIISSPMKRCLQTAEILYPGQPVRVWKDFRECDFGEFEMHNYDELKYHPHYRHWIDSGDLKTFPGGESPADFKKRTVRAFEKLLPELNDAVFIVHGGTIMSILEAYAVPRKNYYDYQIPNAHGYLAEFDSIHQTLNILENL